ncbi:hypothetical protein RJ640_001767 [Escallonia rubra]|uniref:Uncharacterized protein n=1 Tax=Escallonia rubra TaxID=112253 RepID=A0AA88RUN2_9ASTE|nr:hypothetical protein RJ640_001767 [Escallonia rubra]
MATSRNAREGEGHISDDIEDSHAPLITSIREMLHALHPIPNDCSIYRTPTALRKVNEKMYTPELVSLGPLHHGKKELQKMEKHKLRYLQTFVNRTGLSLETCISVIKKHKDIARSCYAEELELTDDEFVKMLLLDSCFVIEVIWRDTTHNRIRRQTDYLSSRELILDVMTDMILLENQIPFFLLDDLYSIAFKDNKFLKLSIRYFSALVPAEDFHKMGRNLVKPKHFLDLLRTCHLPSTPRPQSTKEAESYIRIRSAAELKEAGIDFKRGSSDCLLDIRYSSGVLQVPLIRVDDSTEIVLRNLVALEQCLYPYDSYVIDYIYFMDALIDTFKDVDLLTKKGIIKSDLGDSSTVAALFNNLGMNVMLSSTYYFHHVSVDLNAYHDVPQHKWKATFKRDYCSTPWMIASTVAAIILLALTLIQAICSIISLFKG